MRKVYCNLCGAEFGDTRELIESDNFDWNKGVFAEIQINASCEDICNACRRRIFNVAKLEAKKIKEEKPEEKKDA